VTFSGDGRVLATASSDGLAQAWAAETGDLLFEVIHADVVSCVAFSPDGRVLATGSLDETAQIWRLLGDDHD
jgi:WD40 repeat protein